jgi:subtilisin family serine protease
LALLLTAVAIVVVTDPLATQNRSGRRSTVRINGYTARDGEVLIRYRNPSFSLARSRAEFEVDADQVETIGRRGLRRMRSRKLGTQRLLEILRKNPDVEFVEPNYQIRALDVPDDPSFGNLWGLFNTGQEIRNTAGLAGADIGALQAWDVTTGSRSHVVAVIDGGIDYTHPDLAANMWSAPAPFTVTVGGVSITCPAGSHGMNFIANTCDPMDDQGHGSHVAGTIGAVGDNGIGVAGVNWTASLMGLKFISADGVGYLSDALKAIDFAIQVKEVFAEGNGANVRVLSNSWGGVPLSMALVDAVGRTNAADMLFVAAAGNANNNIDVNPVHPAGIDSPNMIAVAATDNRDRRADFSNYGPTKVHLAAPGVAILSTLPGGAYGYLSGTSMAAPHVAGAAALLLAACELTTAELKAALLSNADPLADLSGVTITGGRLDVNAALRSCLSNTDPTPVIATLSPRHVVAGSPVDHEIRISGSGFTSQSAVHLDGTPVPTTLVNTKTLTATVPAASFELPGTSHQVTVVNLAPSGRMSNAVTVTAALPTELWVEGTDGPVTLAAGGTMQVTVANGPGSKLDWLTVVPVGADPELWTGRYVYLNGATTVPASGLSDAVVTLRVPRTLGEYEVRLFGDGWKRLATSAVITVVPPRPVPAVTAVSPSTVFAGGPGITITVTGSRFHAESHVLVDGAPRPTLLDSDARLTATVTAADLARAGTRSITVSTPAPGGGHSQGLALTVLPPRVVPLVSAVSPASTPVGQLRAPFFVTGSHFSTTSQVLVDGVPRPTHFESNTTLSATLARSELAAPGQRRISVVTPGPSGGTSASVTLSLVPASITVNGSQGPVSLLPHAPMRIAVADGPGWDPSDRLTIVRISPGNGTSNYRSFYLNGTSALPAAATAHALLTLPAPDLGGTYEIRFTAGDGSSRLATSAPITVRMPNPTPTIAALVPASLPQMGPESIVSITGANFLPVSQVHLNGAARATTFVSATQLAVTVPAGEIVAAGSKAISVANPEPGGGMSGALSLVILPVPSSTTERNLRGGAANAPPVVAAANLSVNGSTAPVLVPGNSQLSVVVNGSAGHALDFITLVPSGSAATAIGPFVYLNGSSSPPAKGLTSAVLTLNAPSAQGSYELRLLSNGGMRRLATSAMVSVVAARPAAEQTPVPVESGTTAVASSSTPPEATMPLPPTTTAPISGTAATVPPTAAGAVAPTASASRLAVSPTVPVTTTTLAVPQSGSEPQGSVMSASTPVALRDNESIRVHSDSRDASTAASPSLTQLSPSTVVGGGAAVALTLTGSDFTAASVVLIDGAVRPSTLVSPTELITSASAEDLRIPGQRTITVVSRLRGAIPSTPLVLSVLEPQPRPVLTSVMPLTTAAGQQHATITVTGTNFTSASEVAVDGVTRTTTFVSSTTLFASLHQTELVTPGNRSVSVVTAAPGGGNSVSKVVRVVGASLSANGRMDAITVQPGAPLVVAVSNGPGWDPSDGVAVVRLGSQPGQEAETVYYLNGMATPPASPMADSTFTILAPSIVGKYELKLRAGTDPANPISVALTVVPSRDR